ncbi:unnamed protein product [Ectocarpus fasciculatus]
METEEAVALPTVSLSLKNVARKGRGVYTNEDISYGTLIHISPILLFPTSSVEDTTGGLSPEGRVLSHYTYIFDRNQQALALGLGSMFNHAKNNNVGFIIDKKNLLIRYSSIRAISKGTELCINYGNHLWFEDSGNPTDDCGSSSDEGEDPFGRMEL